MIGDFSGATGPSNANLNLKKGLRDENNILYSEKKNKVTRLIEILVKTLISDAIIICGFSKSNILILKVAKLLRKKAYYLMHGYSTYEATINKVNISTKEIKKINKFERKIFKSVQKVYCVSELFMEFMISKEPDFEKKFRFNNNGIDTQGILNKVNSFNSTKKLQIVSIGGGMPQKNNLEVCKAIDLINKETELNLKYVVIGSDNRKKNDIIEYNFVTYIDKLPHDEILKLLSESILYIQNSDFETFGLSVIEALLCGCDLLISKNIGVVNLLKNYDEKDLILDPKNISEISLKIQKKLSKQNHNKLSMRLDLTEVDNKTNSRALIDKIQNEL